MYHIVTVFEEQSLTPSANEYFFLIVKILKIFIESIDILSKQFSNQFNTEGFWK